MEWIGKEWTPVELFKLNGDKNKSKMQCRKQMGFGVVIVADVPCLDRHKRTKAPTWCCAGYKGKLYNEPVSHLEFV